MSILIAKIVCSIALPFIIVYSFTVTLLRNIRAAFYYAWLDACGEVHAFRKMWSDEL